ncbi:MAG: IS21 family transposase [Candidatus Obscuribacterales bacterium]|nr:IS21 family transposase [Candidatus Obscuribacterales bacterium]
MGTISSQLAVHHSVVQRVLCQDGVAGDKLVMRRSIADPFVPFIQETLNKYPKLTASRLHEMVKGRGYQGAERHFRSIVARYRPRPAAEAYLRLRTLPGEQGQVDWGHFGKIKFGNAERQLLGFVITLSWSRQIFLRFYPGCSMPYFLRGHVDAFEFFGKIPRKLLYDNLKSAVLERVGNAILFNPTMLELAAHYRFEPIPVAVARGNQKGRVEKGIRYVRDSFFAAREWKDLDDLNEQASQWCLGLTADRKCAEDRSMTVREAFELEKANLLALPDNPFPAYDRTAVRVGKTPYVRFDLNDYSVPHTFVKKTLSVIADMKVVRILDGPQEIASHPRCWERGGQIENLEHIKELEEHKKEASQHRGMDRLRHCAPSSKEMLKIAAERGNNLGGLTSGLLKLLDLYGSAEVEQAIQEAVESEAVHLSAVRLVLERRRREKNMPPPVEIVVKDDPRIRDLVVIPHSLSSYDMLHADKENENDD